MGSRPTGERGRRGVAPAAVLGALGGTDSVAVRDGARTVVATDPVEVVVASGAAALHALAGLTPGWWAGFLAYDLGRAIERVAPRTAPTGIPDLVLARFDARLVLDPIDGARVEGDGPGAACLRAACAAAPRIRPAAPRHLGPRRSSLDRGAFTDRVRAIGALLTAGDCYQVNLTRRLTWDRAADPVTLFAALAAENPAPYGSLLRLAGVSVVSASPECFLRWRGRSVETRPVKGTAATAAALESSAKDRAENVMIVDLARNDLGRVSVPGSVVVPDLFRVEAHPGLYHLVSAVRAQLRADVGPAELVGATFPPASVTGAPKPRVLQAIEDLEPVRRGVYCGALGWIDTERGAGDLAVAIRTFTISGAAPGTDGETTLGVGAGIVADSDPDAEWAETELKAARLLRGRSRRVIVGTLSAGTGAFETMRVYRGTPFAWRRHTERLAAAVRALGLVPPDPAGLREAVAAVLRANGLVDARLRVTVIAAPDADADPDIVVAASAVVPPRPHASVVIAPWPRNERAITVGLKSTSYAENVRASADARDLGADEAVFANTRAELCEATGSNVFVVEGGIVRTPPASAGCLLGVTRQLVLEVGARDGIRVEEVARPISALAAADEAFLTSTTREVQGIASVDGRMLPSAPGPVTARLAALFSDLVARDLDP